MNTDAHRTVREALAAHAAGRLSDAERDLVERHLATCAACRADLKELSNLIAAVRSLDPTTIDDAPVPAADLGDRIVSRLQDADPAAGRAPAPRARRSIGGQLGAIGSGVRVRLSDLLAPRPARAVLAAAAAMAILAVGVAVGARVAQPAGPPFEVVAFRSPPPGVEASGKLIAHTWGTEVNLVISGLEAGRVYRVTFVASDGTESDGGTFIGVSGRPILCNLNAAVLRPDVVELRIRDASGRAVLEADLSPPS